MLFRQFLHQKTNKTHRNSTKLHEHETKNRFSATIYISLEVGLGFWKQASTARQSDAQNATEAAKICVADKNQGVVHGKKKHLTHRNTSIDDRFHINFYARFSYIKKRTVSHGLFMAMPWQKPHLGHSAIRKINATWLHSGRQQNEFIARSIQINVFFFPTTKKIKTVKRMRKVITPRQIFVSIKSMKFLFFGWDDVLCHMLRSCLLYGNSDKRLVASLGGVPRWY